MSLGRVVSAILPGEEVTLKGCISGSIPYDDRHDLTTRLSVPETIRLIAKLPGANMQPILISPPKAITIQYPLQLEMLSCPRWLAPGTTQISWKVILRSEG